jgi:hypothetical protein
VGTLIARFRQLRKQKEEEEGRRTKRYAKSEARRYGASEA